jgi:hypothetical protein
MKNGRWKRFEKVTTAIRRVEQEGASVKWNSRVEGYRFDAVIRSTYEGREITLVVRCVDYGAPVTEAAVRRFAEEVEAAGVHMGIMVCASEFTQDAFKLSASHSVALLDWEIINRSSEEEMADTFKPAGLVYDFRFSVEGRSEELALPEEPAVLRFMMRDIRIKGPGIDTFPEQLVNDANEEVRRRAVGKPQRFETPLPPGTVMIHPNFRNETRVKSFAFSYRLIPRAELIDPEVHFTDPYGVEASLKGELAKRNPSADPSRIETGFDTILRPGRYYYNPNLKFSYYCEEVKKGKARIVLVESYQNGGLLQARGTISRPLYSQFVEVTEQSEVDRLTKLYDTFSASDKNLEGRFKVFLRDLEGAESIDDLELTPEQRRANKGDYFFAGRTVIGELKALYEDTASKIEAILEPYRETPEWPLFFGEQDLEKVIQRLPESDKIRAKIVGSVTRSIEAVVEKANRQIRATKETFGLPDAGGLLMILNDAVDILSPDLIVYRVRRALNKRTPDGELRFPNVSAVLVIGGVHYSQMNPKLKGLPILLIPNAVTEAARVEEFVRELNEKWAAFERKPLIHVESEDIPKLGFRRFSEEAKEPRWPMKRHEYWSLLYRRRPYLRQLSEDELLEFGAKALEDVGSRFIKGTPKTPMAEMEPMMIRWSHFLDEAQHRALDLRKLMEKADGLGDRLEALYQKYQEQNRAEGGSELRKHKP